MVKITLGCGALGLAYLAGFNARSGWDVLYMVLGVMLMVVAVASWRF